MCKIFLGNSYLNGKDIPKFSKNILGNYYNPNIDIIAIQRGYVILTSIVKIFYLIQRGNIFLGNAYLPEIYLSGMKNS